MKVGEASWREGGRLRKQIAPQLFIRLCRPFHLFQSFFSFFPHLPFMAPPPFSSILVFYLYSFIPVSHLSLSQYLIHAHLVSFLLPFLSVSQILLCVCPLPPFLSLLLFISFPLCFFLPPLFLFTNSPFVFICPLLSSSFSPFFDIWL